jgi:predicted kinase
MRKWMRERLQRRKKTPAEAAGQPAPPPLQPAYFDAEQQPDAGSGPVDSGAQEGAPPVSAPEARPARRSRVSAQAPPPQEEEPRNADQNPPAGAEAPENSSSDIQASRPAAGSAASSRSRRRRGGRGRGGRGREQAVAQAFAPAAVKGSVPVLPSEPAADEAADSGEAGSPEAESAPSIVKAPAVGAVPKIPTAPVVQQRPPKGIVVLAIGLPGSGKSSWFKRHDIVPLSSDMIRSLLFDDVREQRFQDLVFSNLRSMLKARLIAKRPTNYVDATNLTPQERQHWIKLAKDYQYEVHALFFDVPLEVCVERHQRRDRVVPEDVMRRMAAKLKAPAFEEGFAKITVVRVKKKDNAEAEVAE